MDVLLPPLGNRPSPLQPQMPVKPERKTHIEPYEAEEDPNFSYDGFQVTRREYYAHMLEPAISFADGKLSINAVCLKKAPDVEYVQILVNREQKKLVIRPCTEDDWDSLKWCTAARKTKVITCRMFFAMIMDMMQWDPANRYKIIGKMIHHEDEYLFVFDLSAGLGEIRLNGRSKGAFEAEYETGSNGGAEVELTAGVGDISVLTQQ